MSFTYAEMSRLYTREYEKTQDLTNQQRKRQSAGFRRDDASVTEHYTCFSMTRYEPSFTNSNFGSSKNNLIMYHESADQLKTNHVM